MSIKYKIALLFASLVTLFMLGLGGAIYKYSKQGLTSSFNTRLRNRALSSAQLYLNSPNPAEREALLRRFDTTSSSVHDKSVVIVGYNNQREYTYTDKQGLTLILTDKELERARVEDVYFFTFGNQQAVAVHHQDSNSNFIVGTTGVDVDGRSHLEQLKRILLVALLLGSLLSYATGLVFAKTLTRPLVKLKGEVDDITSSNLSHRIAVKNTKDEMNQLAHTFNSLLDRLEDSFAIQRRFISNASHELSTPLTSISSQLEVAMQKQRSADDYRHVIWSVHEDILEMQQLTRSLLEIAKTGGSQGSIELQEVRLDDVLFKIVADIQRQNPGFKAQLDFDAFPEDEKMLTVFGNVDLLYISLKNIVENGCKYGTDHQAIVTVFFRQSEVLIKVANKGAVIAPDDLEHIFQPFYRAGAAQDKPGFGLGLTLTRRILSLHKGTVTAESSAEAGTVFTVRLPGNPYLNNL